MDPIVSSDCLGKKVGAIVDGLSTNIVEAEGSQLVKVLAWYDNEYGYTAQMLRTAKENVSIKSLTLNKISRVFLFFKNGISQI